MKLLWKALITITLWEVLLVLFLPAALAVKQGSVMSEKNNPLALPPGFEQRQKAYSHNQLTLSHTATKKQNNHPIKVATNRSTIIEQKKHSQ